ncbi:LytTR family DNA-binding domain-containing protein [Paenibacillus daejeonensis]|uniref:LytTR family DNA-binding domain-containing protein n=1 Tax=Paenibacillus daejeonensis TaxID=135193 RepID=UPI000364C442
MVIKIVGVKTVGRKGDETDFKVFALSAVDYIDLYRPRTSSSLVPVYHTASGSYAPLMTLKDLSQALADYGFVQYDRSKIINNSRVKKIERVGKELRITFIDNVEILVSGRSRMVEGK